MMQVLQPLLLQDDMRAWKRKEFCRAGENPITHESGTILLLMHASVGVGIGIDVGL